MTLNITLAGPTGIYQSTDFRLTRMRPGMAPVLQSDASPKQVTLNYGVGPGHWEAVVCYAGVGAYRHIDTCSWLAIWLKGSRDWPSMLHFEDAIECIRLEGSKWLARVSKPIQPHTFVMGALVAGKPQLVLISNYERIGHPPTSAVGKELVVTRRRVRKPMVLVTGMSRAVSRTDQRLLRSMVRAEANPKRIREVLAEMTKRASQSPVSHGTVGASTWVYSLPGGGEIYGEVEGGFIPHDLFNGLDFHEALRIVVDHMGTGQYIPSDNRHG